MTDIDREKLQREIDQNYDKFSEMEFPIEQKGMFALLRDGRVVEIMDTKGDAHKLAKILFADRIYSIQEIHAKPVWVLAAA